MKATFVYKGGKGSGFHGHAGRPGKQGGSTPGKGAAGAAPLTDESPRNPLYMGKVPKSMFRSQWPNVYDMLEGMGGDNDMSLRSKFDMSNLSDVEDYTRRLDIAERAAKHLKGKKLKEVVPEGYDFPNREEGGSPDDDAFEMFYSGEYTDQVAIAEGLGDDGETLNELISEAFDGDTTSIYYKYDYYD